MRIDLDSCVLKGAVGAIVGGTIGAFSGMAMPMIAASSALFGVAWVIKDVAHQVLEAQFLKSSSKAFVLSLLNEGILPGAIVIAHYTLNVFSPMFVGIVWGLFTLEAVLLAAKSSNQRHGILANV